MPIEKTESNALTRTGHRLLFGGIGVTGITITTAVAGGPDGVPTGVACIIGIVGATVGAVLLTVGNKPKVDAEKIIAKMKKRGPRVPESTYEEESW